MTANDWEDLSILCEREVMKAKRAQIPTSVARMQALKDKCDERHTAAREGRCVP